MQFTLLNLMKKLIFKFQSDFQKNYNVKIIVFKVQIKINAAMENAYVNKIIIHMIVRYNQSN